MGKYGTKITNSMNCVTLTTEKIATSLVEICAFCLEFGDRRVKRWTDNVTLISSLLLNNHNDDDHHNIKTGKNEYVCCFASSKQTNITYCTD